MLLEEFGGIINCVQFMLDSDYSNMQTIADAHNRLNDIHNHRFIFGLIIWAKILYRINICSKAIQAILQRGLRNQAFSIVTLLDKGI